jgi:hypothetical protein
MFLSATFVRKASPISAGALVVLTWDFRGLSSVPQHEYRDSPPVYYIILYYSVIIIIMF